MNGYDAGFDAYGEGFKESDCPYSGDDRDDWLDGWTVAYDQDRNKPEEVDDED